MGPPDVIAIEGGFVGVFSSSFQYENGFFFFQSDRRGEVESVERIKIPAAAPITSPVLTSSGSGYGLAWEDRRDAESPNDVEIYFSRLDEGGLVLGGEVRVSKAPGFSGQPALAFSGDSYLLAWSDSSGDTSERCKLRQECLHSIYLARLSNTGAPLGEPQRLTPPDQDAVSPSLIFAETGFLLAFSDTGGDGSPACAADRADCAYRASVLAIDREGKVLKTSNTPNVIDVRLVASQAGPALAVGWAEGIWVASVSPAGDITELSRSAVPVRGVPQFSLSPAREGFWLAVSDTPQGKPPAEVAANDLHLYRLSEDGKVREAEGFPVSRAVTRSETPRVFAAGDGALVWWRESRAALFPTCQEHPQTCVGDLYLSLVLCGEGTLPPAEAPAFAPLISTPSPGTLAPLLSPK
jgi:hypothetical protein